MLVSTGNFDPHKMVGGVFFFFFLKGWLEGFFFFFFEGMVGGVGNTKRTQYQSDFS
jgi:hypothetical protein